MPDCPLQARRARGRRRMEVPGRRANTQTRRIDMYKANLGGPRGTFTRPAGNSFRPGRLAASAPALALLLSGCVTDAQFLAQNSAAALRTAESRGKFELNCPEVQTTVLSQKVIQGGTRVRLAGRRGLGGPVHRVHGRRARLRPGGGVHGRVPGREQLQCLFPDRECAANPAMSGSRCGCSGARAGS